MARTLYFVVMMILFLMMLTPLSLYSSGLWHGVADEDSYLAHALTIGLDFDLDYSNEPLRQVNPQRTVPVHSMGSGLMAAPFVAVFSLIDRAQHGPIVVNHSAFLVSWSLLGFLVAKIFYLFASIWLYYDAARRIQRGLLSPGMTFLLVASSGTLFYVLVRFAMAHAFEFCALAYVVWASVICWERLQQAESGQGVIRRLLLPAMAAQSGVVLNILVRTSNLHVVLLPWVVISTVQYTCGGAPIRGMWKAAILLIGAFVVCAIPGVLVFLHLYGTPFPSMSDQYGGLVTGGFAGSSFVAPLRVGLHEFSRISYILFSDDYGVLYSNPLLIVGTLLGFTCLARQSATGRNWHLGAFAITATASYVVAAFLIALATQIRGMDYGWRYLFSLFPIGFLGYVLWLRSVHHARGWRRSLASLVAVLTVAVCAFSVLGQVLYGGNDRLGPYSKRYETALLDAMSIPSNWGVAMLTRLPAYVAIKTWPISASQLRKTANRLGMTDEQVAPITEDLIATVRAPARIADQLFLLTLFWTVACVWLIYLLPSDETRAGERPWQTVLEIVAPLAGLVILMTATNVILRSIGTAGR